MADEQKGTEYVVLRRTLSTEFVDPHPDDGGERVEHPISDTFTVLVEGDPGSGPIRVRAANDVAAIKAAEKLLGAKFDHGAVAIPARSWRPRVPKDEMMPRRLWS